jgi:PAS domain S-box-containing protein
MSAASISPVNFRLVLRDSLSDSYEMSKVLLATADFDGTLQLLTSGWERVLGYGREELKGKTLLQLMWSDRRGAAAAVAAILDRLNIAPVDVRLLCRNGLAKCFRLHRHYDKHEHMMYIVADEMPENRAHVVRERAERRAAGCRA